MRLEITTHVGCPINCTDCPQALLREKYKGRKTMRFEDYKVAIDKLPRGCRVDFSGMCEPFVHPKCTDMILYAAEKGHPLALYTTLQGATVADWERLNGVWFEVVTIHLPDKNGRSHFHITDEYLDVLSRWDCHNYSVHGAIDDRVRPYMKPRNLITFMHDRAGNVEDRPHKSIDEDTPIRCVMNGRELNHNVLMPDGSVLMCCMDYGCTAMFGNLFTQSYEEVLGSDVANDMRKRLERGETICRKCTNAILA